MSNKDKSLLELYAEGDFIPQAGRGREIRAAFEKMAGPNEGRIPIGRPKALGYGAFEGGGGEFVVPEVNKRGVPKDPSQIGTYIEAPDEEEYPMELMEDSDPEDADIGPPPLTEIVPGEKPYVPRETGKIPENDPMTPTVERSGEISPEKVEQYRQQILAMPQGERIQTIKAIEDYGLPFYDWVENFEKENRKQKNLGRGYQPAIGGETLNMPVSEIPGAFIGWIKKKLGRA